MRTINDFRWSVSGIMLLLSMVVAAQNDSALYRTVTVERDFQPVIQAAGKVSTRPSVVQTVIEPAPVEYSEYTADVQPQTSIRSLLSQPTRFEPAQAYHGHLSAAAGHPNTFFDFGYRVDDGKNSILDLYARHHAEWGMAALSKSKLGLEFAHTFTSSALYFGVNGGNVYYHKYGHFYDYILVSPGAWERNDVAYPKPHTIGEKDKTSLWTAEAYLGIKSGAKSETQYKVQTGYMLFAKPGAIAEHQIRTHASFDWHSEAHHVGLNTYAQNNLLQLTGLAAVIPDSLYSNCHDIRIEPFYAYEGNRIRLHIGANLDMNIGAGHNSLSGIDHLSFAPSPHIHMEAQIARQWLTLYADATGHHGSGSLQEYMEENRYRLIHHGVLDHHFSSYTPIDAELGFRIRPHRDLLLELHGGYAYMLNQTVLVANTDSAVFAPLNMKIIQPGDFDFFYTNYQCGKAGGQLNYHCRDVVRVHLYGDYYFWYGETTVYDRPNWELGLRIDGNIGRHWSVYSDNRFEGSRLALATDGEHLLMPTVDLNLGLQYHMWVGRKAKSERLQLKKGGEQILRPESGPNLTFFFQLNNWLHRNNDIYYGYRSQGINCLLGLTFRF